MNKTNKGQLIVISGPSAVGKGTICSKYIQKHQDTCVSISATTRQPRTGEVHGVNYFFVTKDEFEKGIEEGLYLEYAKVHDHYYGTPIKEVEKKLELGYNIILEIDVQGALQVKKRYEEGVYIFIMPPSIEELEKRIIGRGTETKEQINKRLSVAQKEIEAAKQYDYTFVNHVVEDSVDELEKIIKEEREKQNKCLSKEDM